MNDPQECSSDVSAAVVDLETESGNGISLPVQRRAREIVRSCMAWDHGSPEPLTDDDWAHLAGAARVEFSSKHPALGSAALDSLVRRWVNTWRAVS
ncbi:MAG: hypothetical protein HIU88_13260 [Acidobacteria bacterium]|nr:hypothetical protein [Acidobacteriota bacterium]